MPPNLGSSTFTPDVAKKLASMQPRKVKGYPGYDSVAYRLTRFNGVPRTCSIPHPTAYAHLATYIHAHWKKLEYITKNDVSLVRPSQHLDGRLMIMDYENKVEEASRHLQKSFGRHVLVDTDISNCFPSVYSHAVSWATVGFAYAKKNRNDNARWFNVLDAKVRHLNRNETNGIAIGPATSNIILESILARVDQALVKDFTFVRFLDDYKAYCKTDDEARDFVNRLAQELSRYKLMLNIGKTKFVSLPDALTDDWVSTLALALPSDGEIDRYPAVSYLNLAIRLAKEVPDGSVVKYAMRALIRQKLTFMAKTDVLRYVLTLSAYQPTLLPSLEGLFADTTLLGLFSHGDELLYLARDNARFRRSDGMAWCLFYLNKYGVPIDADTADQVLGSRDCVALLQLYLSGDKNHQASVVKFVNDLDANDPYELDQYWLLSYELFCAGAVKNPYKSDATFKILKDNDVSFVEATK